jgi:MarR family 2-MHQ and catechol resistance regulon transcriptional repressor
MPARRFIRPHERVSHDTLPLPPASGVFGVDDPDMLASLAAYVKLHKASRAILARIEKLLSAYGLTSTQLGVLEGILHKGPLTHRELVLKVLTSAGNMTDVVDKLEARGLVLRSRDTGDRRVVRVDLTASGRALIETVFPRHAADIAHAMSGLDRADLDTLGELLRRLGMAAARDLAGADHPD